MKICFSWLLFILICPVAFSQEDSSSNIKFSGYTEFYYSYDFSNPDNHEKQSFIYNHKRHNEVNVNLIFAKCSYNSATKRANLSLMAGNYALYNLSNEPKILQNILEANVGYKLSKQNNIWLDIGVFPSHIGFESAISADCWNLTRSIVAENSPYFETGAKLTSTNKKETFIWSFLLLNGWQKIQKPTYIKTASWGLQFTYKPNDKLLINYSSFLGTDKPDSLHAVRSYHNFYIQYQSTKKIAYSLGFDVGRDKYDNTHYGIWFSPIAMFRYSINNTKNIALRCEYYNDVKETLLKTDIAKGFNVFGCSTNYDYKILNNSLLRFEAKVYLASEKIFNNKPSTFCLTTGLSIRL